MKVTPSVRLSRFKVSFKMQPLDQCSDSLQARAEQAAVLVHVAISHRLLVVSLLVLVVLHVLVVNGEDGRTVVIELLLLAAVEDNDVFDLAHAVDALDPQEESHKGEHGDDGRQHLEQVIPERVHRRVLHTVAVDDGLADDLREGDH